MERREFLQVAAGAGTVLFAGRSWAASRRAASYFGLHPFVEAHPDAVFVLRTSVTDRQDGEAKGSVGRTLARQLFFLRRTPGTPLSSKIAFKPNLTSNCRSGDTYAIITDREFLGGMIDGMKQTGFAPERMYVRDGANFKQEDTRYHEMAARTGVHFDDAADRETTFLDCPDGVVFKRIGYLGPFLYPDAYLINVAKFKTHAMGLTLCVKNVQGLTVSPYLHFCQGLQKEMAKDFQPDAEDKCFALYMRHKEARIPRWEDEKAAAMEMWAQRTIDNLAVIGPAVGLHVLEGISGQNGDGFVGGPGKGRTPEVFLTNFVLFGKDPFRIDILGHWLAGHEPGNFGLFHLAKERGLTTALDPRNIPIYLWENGSARLASLADLEKLRTPLKTPYLTKPDESSFHMCNEPYDYPSESAAVSLHGDQPSLRLLGHVGTDDEGAAVLEYSVPSRAELALDVHDAAGSRVRRLMTGPVGRGVHMASLDTHGMAAGQYACNLRTAGHTWSVPMRVVR